MAPPACPSQEHAAVLPFEGSARTPTSLGLGRREGASPPTSASNTSPSRAPGGEGGSRKNFSAPSLEACPGPSRSVCCPIPAPGLQGTSLPWDSSSLLLSGGGSGDGACSSQRLIRPPASVVALPAMLVYTVFADRRTGFSSCQGSSCLCPPPQGERLSLPPPPPPRCFLLFLFLRSRPRCGEG